MVDLTKAQAEQEQEQEVITVEVIPASFEKRILARRVVFQFDDVGWYTGPGIAHESPRESGVFYAPPNSTEVQPPMNLSQGTWPRWNGASSEWSVHEIPENKKTTFIGSVLATLKAYLNRIGITDYLINR